MMMGGPRAITTVSGRSIGGWDGFLSSCPCLCPSEPAGRSVDQLHKGREGIIIIIIITKKAVK